ncbi:MAG: tetratricopeptide repeat protein [Lentimicrobium sp.]
MRLTFQAGKGFNFLIIIFLVITSLLFKIICQQKSGINQPVSISEISQQVEKLNRAFDSSFLNNPSMGVKIAGEAIELTRNSGDSISQVRFMLRQAACYQMLDKSDTALSTFRGSLAIAEKMKNQSLIAKCRNGLANYYLRKEEYHSATHQLTEALKAAEKAGDNHATGLIYNGLGLVNISLNKPALAIEYFQKAVRLCRETGDLTNEAGISLNIANCYAESGEYYKALEFYGENLSVLQRINDSSQIILAYINLGMVNRQLGRYDESFRFLERAINSLNKFPNQSLLCTALLEKGNTSLTAGKPEEARSFFQQSLEISTGTLARSNRTEALSGLANVAESEGNFRQALEYFRLYTKVKDSIMNDETRRSISEIQMKNDIQRKEYENRLITGKYELQRKRSLNIGLLSGSLIIFLLLTATLIWLSRKNLKKSYRLQELQNEVLHEKIRTDETINLLEKLRFQGELEARNKELTSTSLQLVSKNKILTDISMKVKESYEAGSLNRESFNDLQRIIRENQNADKEWDQFKELFEKVHADFFTGLKAKFPELTENELRLCAYLRINLQNKEIAKILNVNSATIVTSRYRIRKKMNLDNKTVLEDFLRNF